jgi:gliding motility-associated-like protein
VIFSNNYISLFFFMALIFSTPCWCQENNALLCSDGIDNDGDGQIDCDDSECKQLDNNGCTTCFDDGLSFADYVIEYIQTCGDTNEFQNPEEALGVADNPMVAGSDKYVSLGDGGMIKLGFSDNLIINSGDDAPDIWVFEVGSVVESTTIELLPADPITITSLVDAGVLDSDGDGYYEFGTIMGSTASIDIEEFVAGFGKGVLKFNAIKITDVPNIGCESGSPGADIDAVCALSSVSSEVCDNGIDDDLDGFIDCDDPQLAGDCCCLVSNKIELGEDINTCIGDTILLAVQDVFQSYRWSSGSNLPSIVVTESGDYAITVVAESDCELVDQINVNIQSDPVVSQAFSKCPKIPIEIDDRVFSVPGIYTDTIKYTNQVCDTILEYVISDFEILPDFLGPDQANCAREATINSPWQNTTWPDGSVGLQFSTNQTGALIIDAVDENNCAVTDSINIVLINLGNFFVPTAFSPNNDGVNDEFELFFQKENQLEFDLSIYNRWGDRIFLQSGINPKWNGVVNGRRVENGTYVYLIEYKSDQCDISESFSGDLLLLR